MKLYPPNGGQVPIDCHPGKVDQMKAAGWTEKPRKKGKRSAETESSTETGAEGAQENVDNG